MDAIALHLEIRNALSLADELGRHEHALGNDLLAGQLAAARTVLSTLERQAGRSHDMHMAPSPLLIERLERFLGVLRERAEEIPLALRPRITQLMGAIERVVFAELRPLAQVPAKPLFGVLPLARVVPQDVHSMIDYASAGAFFLSAALARTARGRAMGILLGSSIGGASMVTDYRLSLAKVIPIELHELLDHSGGAMAASAPAILGYAKKDPVASAIQILTGLATIAVSLFTDYRADRGVSRPRRSRGGPEAGHRKVRPMTKHEPQHQHDHGRAQLSEGANANDSESESTGRGEPRRESQSESESTGRGEPRRVSEVQRPLEGFAGPSYIPPADIDV